MEQVGEGAITPSTTPGEINKKLRDGVDPARPDCGLDGDVGLLVASPHGPADQDDQIVVFDEDLAAKVDAGSPHTSQLLDKLGGGTGGMSVLNQPPAGCR